MRDLKPQNRGEMLQDIGIGKDFLDKNQKT
jgi:hypothetical protein